MDSMGGAGTKPQENAEATLMRNGARKWILRVGRDWREIPAPALLAMLCASAFSPLIAVGAGITGAAAVAGIEVLSSVGGGVLTDVITKAIERLRPQSEGGSASPSDIEKVLASEIGKVLATGTAAAGALRAEIGQVLEGIDLGGAMLREAIDSGNEQLRSDLIAAISVLGSDFAELRFLVSDVAAAAARIQRDLDEQRANTRVIIEQNIGQSAEIRRVREDIAVIERRTRPSTRADVSASDGQMRWEGCPYRGLLPFSEADAEIFYGRERLTTELAVKVAGQTSHGGLIVVTGASGAGKSSLLRAGLLPALARGLQVQGSPRWPCRVMTPTKEPFSELATQLASVGGGNALAIAAALAADPGQAYLAARQAVLASTESYGRPSTAGENSVRLVLIVDQFEEIFTLNAGADRDRDAERKEFITALCAMAMNPAGEAKQSPALVVIAVRGDFLDRCAAYAGLATAMQQSQFVVGPMTDSDLRLAITGPADAAGLHLEPSLTETILGDLRAAGTDTPAGVLPLLSQAMLLTWENRDGDRLTSHGYGKSGGISRAIEISADAVYDGLPAASQMLAKQILRDMTAASRDARLSRLPVTTAALYALPGVEQSQADEILERFVAKRLVVLNEGTAEIAHDALLTAWPRLRGWLEEDQASWSLHSQLADDAEEWGRGRQPDFLYRGIQLADFQRTVSTWTANPARYPSLTPTEREFLHASQQAEMSRSRRRRIFAAALVVLLLASLIGGGLAVAAAKRANEQTTLAVFRELVTQSEALDTTNPVTAALLAAAAWRINPGAQARVALLDALAQPERAVLTTGSAATDVAISPNGSLLATADLTGGARLWDMTTHREIGGPVTTEAFAVAFSPNGKILATGGLGTVQLWDVATRRPVGSPIAVAGGQDKAVYEVAFSPDGKTFATADGDGTARLWDVATHRQIGAPLSSPNGVTMYAVAFSPNGKILATGDARDTARLWDVATHRQIGSPITVASSQGLDDDVYEVVFSRDGKTFATAGGDGTARLWDVATHRQIGAPLSSPNSEVGGVAFSPDGKMLATGDGDGTVRLWDTTTQQEIGSPLSVSAGLTGRVAFSPDGQTLAVETNDGTVYLWDVDEWRQIGAPINVGATPGGAQIGFSPDDNIMVIASASTKLWNAATRRQVGAFQNTGNNTAYALAFSPDGKILATADSGDRGSSLWNLPSGRPIGRLLPTEGSTLGNFDFVVALAFSHDGNTLATVNDDGTLRLWDIAEKRQIGTSLTVSIGSSPVAAFGQDGTILAFAEGSRGTLLWDIATRHQIGSIPSTGPNGYASDLAFSPNGKILAIAGNEGIVRLWNVATQRQIGSSIVPGSESVSAVTFSPDGNILATADADGTVRLWDVATQQQIGSAFAPGSDIYNIAFAPSGAVLATLSADGTVRLWGVTLPDDPLDAVCSIAGRSLTRQEWNTYISAEPYQPVCP